MRRTISLLLSASGIALLGSACSDAGLVGKTKVAAIHPAINPVVLPNSFNAVSPSCDLNVSAVTLPAGGGKITARIVIPAGLDATSKELRVSTAGGEQVVPEGDVQITENAELIGKVSGISGETECRAQISVAPWPAPICAISLSAASLLSPGPVNVVVDVTNGVPTSHKQLRKIVAGTATDLSEGSVQIDESTIFAARVEHGADSSECTGLVTVASKVTTIIPVAPPTCWIETSKTQLPAGGGNVDVRLVITNGVSTTIKELTKTTSSKTSAGSASPVSEGSVQLSESTVFHGRVANASGETNCSASVIVEQSVTCSLKLPVKGFARVNQGICPGGNGWAMKDLALAGTASGTCRDGAFIPASLSASGSKGKLTGGLCGWSYSGSGTLSAAASGSVSASLTSSIAISITNKKLNWRPNLVSIDASAKAALSNGQGWHDAETYYAEIAIPEVCKCP